MGVWDNYFLERLWWLTDSTVIATHRFSELKLVHYISTDTLTQTS